jgi:hypothetical protein
MMLCLKSWNALPWRVRWFPGHPIGSQTFQLGEHHHKSLQTLFVVSLVATHIINMTSRYHATYVTT